MARAPPGGVRSEAVAAADINQLDVTTLDSDGIATLIAIGETIVERKEKPPKEGLGPSVAAYANSGGGCSWSGSTTTAKRLAGSHRGAPSLTTGYGRRSAKQSTRCLPLFNCKAVEHKGQSVVAIRVYPGAPPYVLRGSGSVYVREPGGKSPIRTSAQLLEFVRQNGETEASAAARLKLSEELRLLLHTDSDPPAAAHYTHTVG